MKKILVFFLLFFGFELKNVFAETNQCTLQDTNLWEYKTTITFQKNEDLIDAEKQGYDHSFCCTMSNGNKVCDYYNKVDSAKTSDDVETITNTNVDYCKGLNSTFIIIGHVVRLAKILIPIIIIGFGMMDLFKAVVGSKDDEIKKSLRTLIFRCLAGVCIFFLPAFIDLIFSWVDGWETGYKGQYENCFKCIWNVNSCIK